jgi:hypothetical protein
MQNASFRMRAFAPAFASLGVCAAILPSCSGSGQVATERVSSQSQAIHGLGNNPTPDTTFLAVGTVGSGGGGLCTGSLIAPQIVLTAAHCLNEVAQKCETSEQFSQLCDFEPFPQGKDVGGGVSFAVDGIAILPGATDQAVGDCDRASGSTLCNGVLPTANFQPGFDVALLHLNQPVPSTLVAPMRVLTSMTDTLSQASFLHASINVAQEFTGPQPTPPTPMIVGFGRQDDPNISLVQSYRLAGLATFRDLGPNFARICGTPSVCSNLLTDMHPTGMCPTGQYEEGGITIGRTFTNGVATGPAPAEGDSGGPLVVQGGTGVGAGPYGQSVVQLPGVPSGENVVIGVVHSGNISVPNGVPLEAGVDQLSTYAATFAPEVGPWIEAHVNDWDGDGVDDEDDNCPLAFNPDQANCNLLAEQAANARGESTAILGDVCDPVPCPEGNADAVISSTTWLPIGQTAFGRRETHSRIDLHTVGSSSLFQSTTSADDNVSYSPGFTGYPVQTINSTSGTIVVTTTNAASFWFCEYNRTLGFNCLAPQNLEAAGMLSSTPPPNSQVQDPTHPWVSMNVAQTTVVLPGTPFARGGTYPLELGLPNTPFWWDYAGDNAFWHRTGLSMPVIPNPDVGQYSNCDTTSSGLTGTCLDGAIWIDAQTGVGIGFSGEFITDPNGNMVTVGDHVVTTSAGELDSSGDLGSYYFSIRPDAIFTEPVALPGLTTWPPPPSCENCVVWWRVPNELLPEGDPFERLIDTLGRVTPIVAGPSPLLAIALTPNVSDFTPFVSARLASDLTATHNLLANASEARTTVGLDATSVVMSSDATSIIDDVVFNGSQMELGGEACETCGITTVTGPGPNARSAFQALLSSTEQTLFVVGGTDSSGHALGDLWALPLATGNWQDVPLIGGPLGQVLAAAYSVIDRQLWVVDQVGTTMRLLRVHPHAGTVQVLAEAARNPHSDPIWLSGDRDGGIILGTSDACLNTHQLTKVEFVGGQLEASILDNSAGALLAAPQADSRGYALVLDVPGTLGGQVSLLREDNLVPGAPAILNLSAIGGVAPSLTDLSHWNIISNGTILSPSMAPDGCGVLSVSANTWTTITSPALSSTDIRAVAGSKVNTLSFALEPPPSPPNPYWTGNVQVYLSSPSANVYNAYLGQVILTGQAASSFTRETFTVPSYALTALTGNHSDVTLTIALNVSQHTSPWLLTDLRFGQ